MGRGRRERFQGARRTGPSAAVLAAALVAFSAAPGPASRGVLPIGANLACAQTTTPPGARDFGIARLKYGGGGDWYEDRTSLVNLLQALRTRTSIPVAATQEAIVEPGAAALFQYPFVFACGHGNIKFSPTERANLRRWIGAGGFLWVDDDFGIGPSFRREMKLLLPEAELVELPFSHPIYHQLYDFTAGLPKIHEHDGGPARAFGIVQGGRLAVLFTFDADIGDGLEDEAVHHDPPEKHEAALRMAMNVVHYALTH